MSEQQPQQQGQTQQPQPVPVALQPATVEACQADYANGAGARAAMDKATAKDSS